MGNCCEDNCTIDVLRERQRGTLQVVLAINAVMFLVIIAAALYGNSTALLADSLDNLGDALTYSLSLYAVSRGAAAKSRVALFKGDDREPESAAGADEVLRSAPGHGACDGIDRNRPGREIGHIDRDLDAQILGFSPRLRSFEWIRISTPSP